MLHLVFWLFVKQHHPSPKHQCTYSSRVLNVMGWIPVVLLSSITSWILKRTHFPICTELLSLRWKCRGNTYFTQSVMLFIKLCFISEFFLFQSCSSGSFYQALFSTDAVILVGRCCCSLDNSQTFNNWGKQWVFPGRFLTHHQPLLNTVWALSWALEKPWLIYVKLVSMVFISPSICVCS